MPPTDNGVQISNREIYNKLEEFEDHFTCHEVYVERELGRRPTRPEVVGLLGAAGTLSGIVFAAVRFL